MRLSRLFTKTQKTDPKDEESVNAKLLIRAGYIRKMSAGVYSYLPLGWRVLEKINRVIREEMNAIGGQELLMPALVAKEYWEKSRRWGTEVMYKLESPYGEDFGLGWTHEEVITSIANHFINSYKDLPLSVYQIQTKFRAEPRAKNGLLRGREFMMKDLYSFHVSEDDLNEYYQEVIKAYGKILKRLNLKYRLTEASGGAFTKEYTHEFQVLNPAGEDTIFYCDKCEFSQNKEIAHVQRGNVCPNCGGEIQESRGIEVANVFKLGTRYSQPYDLRFTDREGEKKLVIMGSYGIGPTRLMATLVEEYHDNKGIIWPEGAAPYQVHLVEIRTENLELRKRAEKFYNQLNKTGVEVLYDDRDISAGEKLADADLLGIPWRAIVSEKTGAKVELKRRGKEKVEMVSVEELLKKIK